MEIVDTDREKRQKSENVKKLPQMKMEWDEISENAERQKWKDP